MCKVQNNNFQFSREPCICCMNEISKQLYRNHLFEIQAKHQQQEGFFHLNLSDRIEAARKDVRVELISLKFL